MTSSSKPSLPLSKVPSVRELCELLGFQQASLKDTNTFMEAARAWRKSYHTSSGRPATKILHWNQPSDQLDLEEMAQDFLDKRGGNGERFWSPDRSWNRDSDLQLPEDRAQIVALLKQLFWKQNRYAFNNTHYGHKDSEPRDQSRESTTPARQMDRAMNGGVSAPLTTTSARAESGSAQVKPKSPRNPSKPAAAVSDERSSKPPPTSSTSTGGVGTSDVDIFEVPDDSDSYDATSSRLPKRPHPLSSNTESPRKKKKYHLTEPLRRTDRKRVIRSVPDTVPNDQIEQYMDDTYDEIEAHDRTDHVQPTGSSSPAGSRDQSSPRSTTKVAETNSKNPLPLASPVAGRPAPIAPMVSSDIHKSSSLQLNASRVAQGTYHPERGQNLAPSSPRYYRTMEAIQPKSWEPASPPRMEPVLEREKRDSRTSRGSPSAISDYESEVYSLAKSTTTIEAGPIGHSSGVDDSKPIPSPNSPLLHSKDNKLAMHRPAAKQSTSSPKLSPSPSANDFGRSENRQDRPRELSDEVRTLAAVSEAAPTKRSRLETPSHSTETANDKMNGSTTAANRPQVHERKEPTQGATSEPSSAKPRQKTQIPLWIITREPRYTEERWDDGKFMGTPLPAFIEGISKVTQRRHIEKIKLTLRAPTFDTKITVYQDAEDSWASAKETFIEKLKEAKAEARARRQTENVTFKILVEPFYEEGVLPSGGIDEDEEEFDF
ncbi:hypothetical protein L207DRAFT_569010 [Hyaloscypha variabilis F]|uniref:Uncharacterized protein n=1 Tax=Hyaloscypha variabilis (strain UAMH 11265 / GT02V1 / F) TaxID=1149755 RepID=A0A2J6REA4_HYAVF|nr:hypothetical protein L207DRAFT_569010 [Hyaloscypha variabilis F]